ncbi:phytoene/squalene synthase family protein [bacterium]|nr:phytoene/squalene synthase family protein [bacterium]
MMNIQLELCHKYNRQLLKVYSKSFFISTLLLPRSRRKAVYALYGFCRFMDNLVDKPRDRSKEELIQEIHDLEKELKIACRTGESEHPVLCSFIHIAGKYRIPIEHPLELVRGILMDVDHQHYQTFQDLYLFCHRVAGVVGLMMTHVLGYSSDKAFGYAAKLGIAMQLTNILRDIQEDKNNGRIYLPLDEMEKFNVQKTDILQENVTPELKKLIRFSVDRAHRYYQEASPGIEMLTPQCRFAIYSASDIYRNILHEIESNDYNPFLGRVYVTQVKKTGIILSNYFREKLSRNRRQHD